MLLYSLYPTDTQVVLDKVVQQAKKYGITHFFISLHIPESERLHQFIDYIGALHRDHGFQFYADISPHTLTMLDMKLADLSQLKAYGIIGLRIDFGFTIEDCKTIHALGFVIAMNASTLVDAELEALAGIDLIGWHNYYPRPETGINADYFRRQNAMLRRFQRPIYSFIPGVDDLRAPLHLGLPVLETQRNQNAYINYLEQRIVYGIDFIAIAEGTIPESDMDMIMRYENDGVITIPLCDLRADWYVLYKSAFPIRIEETDYSWRIEGTRGHTGIDLAPTGKQERRLRGSLQMDNSDYGRYAGEVHIMRQELSSDARIEMIGMIAHGYEAIVDMLGGHPMVQFTNKNL